MSGFSAINYALAKKIVNKGECVTISNIDLNTLQKGGLYYVKTSCTHKPDGCSGGFMCVLYNESPPNTFAIQLLFNWKGEQIYYRALVGGSWYGWTIINTTKVVDEDVTNKNTFENESI